MIATGMTDNPSAARWIVETIMADVRNAGWAEVLRVPVPGEASTETELTAWPPPGEVWVCRRTSHDGFTWLPLFCAEPDIAKQRQPWSCARQLRPLARPGWRPSRASPDRAARASRALVAIAWRPRVRVEEPRLVREHDGLDAVARFSSVRMCVMCVLTVVSQRPFTPRTSFTPPLTASYESRRLRSGQAGPESSGGDRRHRPADPRSPAVRLWADLDGARPPGEPALVDQQGLAAGRTVAYQVASRWPGRASGRDILDPAGVIPGSALRAIRVEHVGEAARRWRRALFRTGDG